MYPDDNMQAVQKKFPVQPSPMQQTAPTLSKIGHFLWDMPSSAPKVGIKPAAPAPAGPAPYNPWTVAPSHPAILAPSASAPKPAAPVSAPAHMGIPAEEVSRINQAGGNPANFQVQGSQLMSARSPAAIQADITAHPPITTQAGKALIAPAAPAAAVPTIGVQGQAPAGQPGVQGQSAPQVDPARAALHSGLRQAQSDASRYGQGQWVFPPGTGTDPVWQANTAHERIAGFTNALAGHNQTDPAAKIGMIDAINADPSRRATALAMQGVDPNQIAALPQPGNPVDPATNMNAAQWLEANKGLPLHDKLASIRHDTSNPAVRQALQLHLDSQYAKPDDWEAAASQLPSVANGDYQYSGPAASFLSGPSNLAAHAWDRTWFGGQIRMANPAINALMQKHGLRSPVANQSSAQIGISNPN